MPCSAFTSPKFTRNINPNICSNQWQRFCGRPSLSCRWQFVSPNDYIWNKTMFKGHCGTSCRFPVSKWIKDHCNPTLLVVSPGKGLSVTTRSAGEWFLENTPAGTWDPWKTHVWRSQGVRSSSSKRAVGGERLSHMHHRHTFHQSVNTSTFFYIWLLSEVFSWHFGCSQEWRIRISSGFLQGAWIPSHPTFFSQTPKWYSFVSSASQRIIPLKFLMCLPKNEVMIMMGDEVFGQRREMEKR